MTDFRLLTVAELGSALNVKPWTIHEWTRQVGPQSIPRYRVGRGYRFILAEVVGWIRTTRDERASASRHRIRRMPATRRRRAPENQSGGHRRDRPRAMRRFTSSPEAGAVEVPPEASKPLSAGAET